jgi:hypothetical protein
MADTRNVVDAIIDEVTRGFVPIGLLRESAVSRVVTGLF